MNSPKPPLPSPHEVLEILAGHWRRWLTPAVLLGIAAAVYALVSQPTWQASQALILRNEAANADATLGKFSRSDDMKTVQETILELVKSRAVLSAALVQAGPPAATAATPAWPADRDVQQLREAVKLVPPNGAEFGATEVFYLEVRDHDRARAMALSGAISAELQAQFQQLRDLKAQSMIDELSKTVTLADADLKGSLARLSKLEAAVGSDLAELRVLNDATSGDSAIRRTVTEIENELRQARAADKANEQLLGLLQAAGKDPGQLLATPNRLLESQPALRRLKDGLVDAQLRTAALQGRMSAVHPLVLAAKEAEEKIGRDLYDELVIAARGVEGDRRLTADRVVTLQQQLAAANQRLRSLAEVRAVYSSQVAETASRTRLLERAQQNLAEARSAHASAKAASLLTCIDGPDAGIRPVGPSRAMIVLMGIIGGLLVGFGIVFLTVPATETAPAAVPALDAVNGSGDRQRSIGKASGTHATAALGPVTPAFAAGGNLSLKQALHKIARQCGV
jgi:uncharacterized protein involved in exopolysaccharide biosynthesis